VTVSISQEARRLLKVGAATEDATPGMIVDRLIKAAYEASGTAPQPIPMRPEAEGEAPQEANAPFPEPEAVPLQEADVHYPTPTKENPLLTADEVRRDMERMRLTQVEVSKAFPYKISAKAISDWLVRGDIPLDRQIALKRVLDGFERTHRVG
jgi:hypothetical protein